MVDKTGLPAADVAQGVAINAFIPAELQDALKNRLAELLQLPEVVVASKAYDLAVADPAPFTYGNTGRLLPYLRGPGLVQLDMSLFKEIPVHERLHLQFRAEVFNILTTSSSIIQTP